LRRLFWVKKWGERIVSTIPRSSASPNIRISSRPISSPTSERPDAEAPVSLLLSEALSEEDLSFEVRLSRTKEASGGFVEFIDS
jgi:hypothetical protein